MKTTISLIDIVITQLTEDDRSPIECQMVAISTLIFITDCKQTCDVKLYFLNKRKHAG